MKRLYNIYDKKILRERLLASQEPRTTISFYQYHHLDNPKRFRDQLYADWSKYEVFGRVYVSYEGINAQVSVPTRYQELFKEAIYAVPFLNGIRLNYAIEDNGKSFYKLIIKVREKIVADGLDDATFDVTNKGKHLTAAEFNQLAEDPNTIIVDMRNHYESEIGHFKNAILPDVETFREALPLVENMLDEQRDKNLVMYCTGGIRCEKASAYFKHKGFNNVFQLNGGIIEYARQVEEQGLENKYIGKNFVFDDRLSEAIGSEVIAHCHQCGTPCDTHVNCANNACHLLFIQCPNCAVEYDACCSTECRDFHHLPQEEQMTLRKTHTFNGSRFSKNTAARNLLRRDNLQHEPQANVI